MASKINLVFMVLAAFFVVPHALADTSVTDESLPLHMGNFRMLDVTGAGHELYSYRDHKAIVLMIQGNGCPIVRQTFPYFMQIRDEFASQGVLFLMMNSNDLDDPESIRLEAEEYSVDIPVLKDATQAVARSLGSERTAEIFLVDPKSWNIIYRGEADDRFAYGLQRSNPKHFYLKEAIAGWLKDGSFPEERIRVTKGCLMDLRDIRDDVEFARDIAPILTTLGHTWGEQEARTNEGALWDMLRAGSPGLTPEESHDLMSWLVAVH